jgi:hypothetical protein
MCNNNIKVFDRRFKDYEAKCRRTKIYGEMGNYTTGAVLS